MLQTCLKFLFFTTTCLLNSNISHGLNSYPGLSWNFKKEFKSFYEDKNQIRCRAYPKRSYCDPSHLESMSNSTRFIKLKNKDAREFQVFLKHHRKPELMLSDGGGTIIHKLISPNISILFTCSTKYPGETKCKLFIDPIKKDPTVKIKIHNSLVNIQFYDPKIIKKISQNLAQRNLKVWSSQEKIKYNNKDANKVCLFCTTNYCEFRGFFENSGDLNEYEFKNVPFF